MNLHLTHTHTHTHAATHTRTHARTHHARTHHARTHTHMERFGAATAQPECAVPVKSRRRAPCDSAVALWIPRTARVRFGASVCIRCSVQLDYGTTAWGRIHTAANPRFEPGARIIIDRVISGSERIAAPAKISLIFAAFDSRREWCAFVWLSSDLNKKKRGTNVRDVRDSTRENAAATNTRPPGASFRHARWVSSWFCSWCLQLDLVRSTLNEREYNQVTRLTLKLY